MSSPCCFLQATHLARLVLNKNFIPSFNSPLSCRCIGRLTRLNCAQFRTVGKIPLFIAEAEQSSRKIRKFQSLLCESLAGGATLNQLIAGRPCGSNAEVLFLRPFPTMSGSARKPTNWERKLLVWTGKYASDAQIPEVVP